MDNVVLVGFMGTGKDSVAKKVAEKTDITLFSTDKYITLKTGKTIKDIFKANGESYFRKIESEALERIILLKNLIIATGGGAPLLDRNKKMLKQTGKIVHLYCDIEKLKSRLKKDTKRPLIKMEKDIERIFNERKKIYDFSDFRIDTSDKSINEVANLIIEKFNLPFSEEPIEYKNIWIKTKSKKYPVYIGTNIIENINDYLNRINIKQGKVIIISDFIVSTLFSEKIIKILKKRFKVLHFTINEGEINKNLNTIRNIYDFLSENRITRDDFLIALGGGITGDIVGFAASTFKRGIKYIQIPTTLLAQVDSSIGGKTGINNREGKNMIGSFYQPEMVLSDISFLKTLSNNVFKSGISEVIKYGIIKDSELFSILEKNKDRIIKRKNKILMEIISRCIKIKGDIVEKDENEKLGIRELLNFGHTIGHIIESNTGYKTFSHGEAVAIGMYKETEIAENKGFIAKEEVKRIKDTILSYNLPIDIPENISENILSEKLSQDKKVRNGKIKIPIPVKIGKTIIKEVLCENYL